jgi:hypothetical protein
MLYKRIVPHELRTFIKRIPKDFDPSQTLSRYTATRFALSQRALRAPMLMAFWCPWVDRHEHFVWLFTLALEVRFVSQHEDCRSDWHDHFRETDGRCAGR